MSEKPFKITRSTNEKGYMNISKNFHESMWWWSLLSLRL